MSGDAPNLLVQCQSALQLLNGADTPQPQRHAADQWLIQFQQQPQAWTVIQLLHQQGLPEYTHYYAASTLYGKLLFSFEQLNSAAVRADFRLSLRHALVNFSGSDKVKTRLAMCVAALGVHLMALDEWVGCVGELMAELRNNAATSLLLLDILAYLPEECNNIKLRVPHAKRRAAQLLLLESCTSVLELLQQALASSLPAAVGAGGGMDALLLTPNAGPGAVLLPHNQTPPQLMLQEKVLRTFLAWIKASGHARRTIPGVFTAHMQQQLTPASSPTAASAAAGVASAASAISFSHASNPLANSSLLIAHPLLLFAFKCLASRVARLEQVSIDVLGALLHDFNLVSRHCRGGFRGFRNANQWQDDEREEGEVDRGQLQPSPSPSADGSTGGFSFASSPTNSSSGGGGFSSGPESSQYEHLYFMRFLMTRILQLVPLFDALNVADPSVADLARCYARLFVDLGEYYLDFVMEFCLGEAGFRTPHQRAQLLNLMRTMLDFAYLAHSNPKLAAPATTGSPVPVVKPTGPAGFQLPSTPALLTVEPQDVAQLLVLNKELAEEVVKLMLKCSAHPRREVHSHTFYFWFRLSEALVAPPSEPSESNTTNEARDAVAKRLEVLGLGTASTSTALAISYAKRQMLLKHFLAMVEHLHRIISYPPNVAPQLPPPEPGEESEEQEEAERVRYHAAECLLDVVRVLDVRTIFSALCSDAVLGAQFVAFKANPRLAWRPFEASLFCIRNLADPVLAQLHDLKHHLRDPLACFEQAGRDIHWQFLPLIFNQILRSDSPVLLCAEAKVTAIHVIGAYAAWIKAHGKADRARVQKETGNANAVPNLDTTYLFLSFCFLEVSLQQRETCAAAARAFRYLCQENRKELATAAYLQRVMLVYNKHCAVSLTDRARHPNTGHSLEEQKQIIEGVANVVSSVAEQETLRQCLEALMTPMVHGLKQICALVPSGHPLPAEAAPLVNSHLDRLGETFARLVPSLNPNTQHFVVVLRDVATQLVAPSLFELMARFDDDERRMDKVGRVFKWLIKTIKLQLLNQLLLSQLTQNLLPAFARHQHACLLYLFSVLVDTFGAADGGQFVGQYLGDFLRGSLPQVATTELMAQNPDMTEDFFETCTKVLRTCPDKLFTLPEQLLSQIIEKSILALPLHHKDSLSAASNFLSVFLEHGIDSPRAFKTRIGPVVDKHRVVIVACVAYFGPQIAQVLVSNIAFALPTYRLPMMTGLMENLLALCKQHPHPAQLPVGEWFAKALAPLPQTVDPTKEEFLADLLHHFQPHTGRWEWLKESILRFADAVRILQQAPR